VVNVGNLGIGVAACPDCIIENNVVVQQQSFGSMGISVPDRDRDSLDEMSQNVTVRNNSLYMSSNDSVGIYVGEEGTSHVVVNNAIYFAGSGNFSCFDFNLPTGSYEAIDNNLCYYPNSSVAQWEAGSGDLNAWRTASGFDMNSIVANPLFVSPGPTLHGLNLSSGSPAINAGHASLSSSQDMFGVSRDASPDIGAYEYSGG
jgi:hypothetical protein